MPILNGVYQHTPLNTSDIPQDDLNINRKVRSNPLVWNGQFSPQLIEVLLKKYATPDSIILDPFLGSGTVLLEAGRIGLAAYGSEINPAAIALTRPYTLMNVPPSTRRLYLRTIQARLDQTFPESNSLFNASAQVLESEIIRSRLADLVFASEERWEAILLEALVTLVDVYQADLSVEKIFATWHHLAVLIRNLPYSSQPIDVFHTDARKIPLDDAAIHLSITSPPYINVFNYHQQYRGSVEALHWRPLIVAQSEIGANRKHRSNRFLTVTQFCLDIAQTFQELVRVSHSQARLIFIVGRESTVRGVKFLNGELVCEVACQALCLHLLTRQERVFTNRFGEKIIEDILHFSVPTPQHPEIFLDTARKLAYQALNHNYRNASEGVKGEIKAALDTIEKVTPSPLFDPVKAFANGKR